MGAWFWPGWSYWPVVKGIPEAGNPKRACAQIDFRAVDASVARMPAPASMDALASHNRKKLCVSCCGKSDLDGMMEEWELIGAGATTGQSGHGRGVDEYPGSVKHGADASGPGRLRRSLLPICLKTLRRKRVRAGEAPLVSGPVWPVMGPFSSSSADPEPIPSEVPSSRQRSVPPLHAY